MEEKAQKGGENGTSGKQGPPIHISGYATVLYQQTLQYAHVCMYDKIALGT